MKKTLRPYQQNALNTLKSRLKETDNPLVVNASVGAGKSVIIAELLLVIERAGWRALCLTMNSTLIKQNTETYINQGGDAGIFCAALNRKETNNPVIFASPMSVRMDIKSRGKLSEIPFNLIVIDECHNVNFEEQNTTYMRIFKWYFLRAQEDKFKLRFVGLTGTPYRGKGISIIGDNQFFKEEVCSIPAEWLIKEGYLTKPVFGQCDKSIQYDFDSLKTNNMGKFQNKELEKYIHKNPRLTAEIMLQVKSIVKNRRGAFIFASTIQHCKECAEWLPGDETAIITGETPDFERERFINEAKAGKLKYLINVNVLTTGVDIPAFDTVVFVRPTESLVLYIQCLGRGLRLYEGKSECLILDYAGNLDRHGDLDNQIINQALQPKPEELPDYCFPCYECNTFNKITARRCIGIKDASRCDFYFEWKNCIKCETVNDKTSRYCRECNTELVDPNAKLKKEAASKNYEEAVVISANYSITNASCFRAIYKIKFINKKQTICVTESYRLLSQKSLNIFYGKFIRVHLQNPSEYYPNLSKLFYLKQMITNNYIKTPHSMLLKPNHKHYKIIRKIFASSED